MPAGAIATSGFACHVSDVSLPRRCDHGVLQDIGLRGKVFSIGRMTSADLQSMRSRGYTKLLASPSSARQVTGAQAAVGGEEELEVIGIDNVASAEAILTEALWGGAERPA